MLEYFCFKITNFDEYLKKNQEDKIKYEIFIKETLCRKFQEACFPTYQHATILVRMWPKQKFDQMFVSINLPPSAFLEPFQLTQKDLEMTEHSLASDEMKATIRKSPYRDEKNFLSKTAGIVHFKDDKGNFTAYGFHFQIETFKHALTRYKPEKSLTRYFTGMLPDFGLTSPFSSNHSMNEREKYSRSSWDSWYPYSQRASNFNPPLKMAREYMYNNVKFYVSTESIVEVKVEAITNSLDYMLSFQGTGIAGMILKKFGNKIDERTYKIGKNLNLTPGKCFEVETQMKTYPRYVINVISPKYDSVYPNQFERELAFTFMNLFECANTLELTQLALPLLCTGNFGAPKLRCANILVKAAFDFLDSAKHTTLKQIHFVNIDQEVTGLLIEEIELLLAQHLSASSFIPNVGSDDLEEMQTSEENIEQIASQKTNANKMISYNDSTEYITCQVCRQRTRSWFEINSCKHKWCTLCEGENRESNDKCIVNGCVAEHTSKSIEHEPMVQENSAKTCEICKENTLTQEEFVTLKNCGHEICKICFKKCKKTQPKCPFCMVWFEKPIGNQPKDGKMTYKVIHTPLPGYEQCKTIEITYSFLSGIQEANHPQPGEPYDGTCRKAYLPNNEEGQHVLKLLIIAFENRLTFTIGDSVSTSVKNAITWNDIHHKTSINEEYGYPDSNYLQRVTAELKAKGIE